MRTYAIHRPIGPFTWPSEHRDKVSAIVNFDRMEFVPEIGRNAFGYIEWAENPPAEDLARYELVAPPTEDPMWDKIGRILARFEQREQWERFERAWDLAKERFGYSEDWIERTWLAHSEQEA